MAYDTLHGAEYIRQIELAAEAVSARKVMLAERVLNAPAPAPARKLKASEARKLGLLPRQSKASERSPVNTAPGTSPNMPRETYRSRANQALNRRSADHAEARKPIASAGAPRYRTGRGRRIEVSK